MNRIILLLFVFVNVNMAQDYVNIFNDLLPEQVAKNEIMHKQINHNFDKYWKCNPDLFYYYLSYLNTRHGDENNRNPEKNGFNFLWNTEQKIVTSHNKLISTRLKDVTLNTPNGTKRYNALNFIEALYLEERAGNKVSNKIQFDENYANYLILKRILRNSDLQYQSRDSYFDKCKIELEKIKTNLLEAVKNNPELEEDKIQTYNDLAIEYHFLFSDHKTNKFSISLDITLDKYLIDIYSNNNKLQYGLKFLLSTNFLSFSVDQKRSFEDARFPYTKIPVSMEYKSNGSFEIGMGLRVPLKNEMQMFAYLDINFLTYLQVTNKIKSDYIKAKSVTAFIPGRKGFVGEYLLSDVDVTKEQVFMIQFTSPLYQFTENFYVSAGITLASWNFEANTIVEKKAERIYSDDPNDEILTNQKYTYTDDEIIIRPLISFNYNLMKALNIKLEFSDVNRVILGTEFIINF